LGCEDRLRQKLSDYDRKTIENDTPELAARDENVIERYRKAYGPSDEEIAAQGARAKAEMKSMVG